MLQFLLPRPWTRIELNSITILKNKARAQSKDFQFSHDQRRIWLSQTLNNESCSSTETTGIKSAVVACKVFLITLTLTISSEISTVYEKIDRQSLSDKPVLLGYEYVYKNSDSSGFYGMTDYHFGKMFGF